VNLNQALRLVSDAVCKEIPTAVLSASPGTTRVNVRLSPQKHHYLADAQEQLDQALRKVTSALLFLFSSQILVFLSLDPIDK
jgi:hypothetical protein